MKTESFEEIYQEESIDYKLIIFKILKNWYWLLLSVSIALTVVYLYNKYTPTTYQANTNVLINAENDPYYRSSQNIKDGFGLFTETKILENEIIILKSYSLVHKTISQLNFGVTYYEDEGFIVNEIYRESPFFVEFDTSHAQLYGTEFHIHNISASSFHLSVENEDISIHDEFKFEETISSEYFSFTVGLKPGLKQNDLNKIAEKEYFFVFNDRESLAQRYRGGVNVSPVNEDASIVTITATGQNPQKTVDFLNKLTEVYLNQNLARKNEIAVKTVQFIDSQLSEITDSLQYTEMKLQNFRASNRIMDLSFQAQRLFEKMQELESERAVLKVKMKYYNSIKNYFENNRNVSDLIAPSAMGVDDPILNKLISQLIELNNQKQSLQVSNSEENPFVISINKQIENLKRTIEENLENIVETTQISLKDINNRMFQLEREISKLPKTERELFGIERQFKLNDAVYTFLLQRRAEAQIAKASNMPEHEIIDTARLRNTAAISPRKRINFLIGLFIGLVIPLVIIFGKDFFKDEIIEKKDIEKITDIPILGHIFHNKKTSSTVIKDSPKSSIAEAFRSIRTTCNSICKKANVK